MTIAAQISSPVDEPVATAGWLLLVVPLLLLQFALLFHLAAGGLTLSSYLAAHLALCGGAGFAGGTWAMAGPHRWRPDRLTMATALIAWTTLAGPFGALVAAAFHTAAGVGAAATGDAAPPASPGAPERLDLLEAALLDRRLRVDAVDAIRSLLDVMLDGSQTEKFDALSLISKRYGPDAAPALRRGLADPDGAVRVLAATVIAQHNNACTRRIGECLARAQATPEAPDGWRELAQAHVDYAQSGLLEAARADGELAQSAAFLARAAGLARLPGDATA